MNEQSSNNSLNHKNSEGELQFSMIPGDEKSSNWHQRMANLVGLEEEMTPSHQKASDSEPMISSHPEVPPTHPSSHRTKQPLSSNPFAKVGVVGAGTLFVVLVAGVFLSQLMGGTNQKPQNNFPVVTQKNEAKKIEQLKPEEEIEILKTKLALAEQAKAVKAAQLQLKTVQPPTRTTPTAQPKPQPTTATRVVVQRIPTPAKTVYVPRVVERIVRVPQPIAQAKPTPTPSPQPTPTPQPKATPSPSPSFEISNPGLLPSDLAQIPLSLSTVTPPATPPLPNVASLPPSPPPSARESDERTLPRRTNPTTNSQEAQPTKQLTGKAVAVGASAKAVLTTALAGEAVRSGSNTSNNKNDSQFVVRLKEPLKSVDGGIALPKDTELITQIQQITESGWVQLSVISIISQANGNLSETRLPQNAMKIRAPGGRALLANKYPKRSGKIASMDGFSALLGASGQIGEILNRPESRVRERCPNNNNNNGNCYFATETEQQRNIPAAILEGATKVTVPQLNQRNQQAVQEMMKSNIWYLAAGTEVEVFANQITRF
jgi:hypothetical protein